MAGGNMKFPRVEMKKKWKKTVAKGRRYTKNWNKIFTWITCIYVENNEIPRLARKREARSTLIPLPAVESQAFICASLHVRTWLYPTSRSSILQWDNRNLHRAPNIRKCDHTLTDPLTGVTPLFDAKRSNRNQTRQTFRNPDRGNSYSDVPFVSHETGTKNIGL